MIVSSALIAYYLHTFELRHQQSALPRALQEQRLKAGTLTVDVLDNPTFSSIPPGAQNVPMMQLRLHASCESDVHIEDIGLRRVGLGDRRDIESLYAAEGYHRISNVMSVAQKDGSVQLRVRRFSVFACTTKTVTIFANFSTTAARSGEHRLILDAPSSIYASGAKVLLGSEQQTPVRRTVGPVEGRITAKMLSLSGRVRVGDRRNVARLQLMADGDAHHSITGITLTNDGSAHDADLENLVLETSAGERISNVLPQLQASRAVFRISPPLKLRKNRTRTLVLKADVRTGARKTLRFILEEPSDIVSVSSRSSRILRNN